MALKPSLPTLDGVDPIIAAEYQKKGEVFVLNVEGGLKLQSDVDKLQGALNAERTQSKQYKTALDAWGERNPEEVLAVLDKLPELEAAAAAGAKKIDQAAIDGIVQGRLAPLQRELDKYKTDYAAAQQTIAAKEAADKKRLIHDTMRAAGAESGAHATAYSSPLGGLMLLSEQLFEVNGTNEAVVREGAPGGLIPGTLLKDAIPTLQAHHGYLWPSSQGGGATGNTGSGGPQANAFKTNSATARSEFVRANKDRPEVIQRALREAGLSHEGEKYIGK